MMRNALLRSMIMTILVSSCGDAAVSETERKPMADFRKAVVPEKFPYSERIEGKLNLTEQTHFCVLAPTIGDDSMKSLLQADQIEGQLIRILEKVSTQRGWSPFIGYIPRVMSPNVSAERCSRLTDPILVRFDIRLNGSGKPYRLALAAWQDEATWLGAIERRDGNYSARARVVRPIEGGEISAESLIRGSLAADADKISGRLVEVLKGAREAAPAKLSPRTRNLP